MTPEVAAHARGPDQLIHVFYVEWRRSFTDLDSARVVAQFRTSGEASAFVDQKIAEGAPQGQYLALSDPLLASQAEFGIFNRPNRRPLWYRKGYEGYAYASDSKGNTKEIFLKGRRYAHDL